MREERGRRRWLALAGRVDFWPEDEPFWLVSPGCVPSDPPEMARTQPEGTVGYPWRPVDLPQVHELLRARYEAVLTQLVVALNAIHGIERSRSYWHRVVGPWLFHYLNLLTHHGAALDRASRELGPLRAVGLDERDFTVPRDGTHFLYEATSDRYNLQLFTRLGSLAGIEITEVRRAQETARAADETNPDLGVIKVTPWVSRVVLHLMERSRAWVERRVAPRVRVLCRRPYWPDRFARRLERATRGRTWHHRRPTFEPRSTVEPDPERRSRLSYVSDRATDAVDRYLERHLGDDVPVVFVEEFARLLRQSESDYQGFSPRVVFSTIAWLTDHAFCCFAADRADHGALLVGGQHGGLHGIEQHSQIEAFERSLVDRYLTWGWDHPDDPGRLPAPASRLVESRDRPRDRATAGVLYVGTVGHRFPVVARGDFSGYFGLQRRFFSAASDRLRSECIVRLHAADFGWDVRGRLTRDFPELKFQNWGVTFDQALDRCRVYVCDHLSTTFATALARNVPTVMFWDSEFTPVREGARPFFDALRGVGVVHDTPESAAEFTGRTYDEVDRWWFAPSTQQAVSSFRERFARTVDHPLHEWCQLLESLTRDAGSGRL